MELFPKLHILEQALISCTCQSLNHLSKLPKLNCMPDDVILKTAPTGFRTPIVILRFSKGYVIASLVSMFYLAVFSVCLCSLEHIVPKSIEIDSL